jgi:hypothetical protein
MAKDGSGDEVGKSHRYSEDLFAGPLEGFQMGKLASAQKALRYRPRRLDEGCSLAAASQALEMKEPWFPGRACAVRRSS